MTNIAWLLKRFTDNHGSEALVWRDRTWSYGQLLELVVEARANLTGLGLGAGSTFILDADFSPRSIAVLLAGWDLGCIVVPIAAHVAKINRADIGRFCGASWHLKVGEGDSLVSLRMANHPAPTHVATLQEIGAPGVILFTSGSTGLPKGVVHDVTALLRKFQVPRHRQRLLTFLLFDHIGGINTLCYALSNGGCAITVPDRDVRTVCCAIQNHKVEVLPASPTFLNLMLLSGVLGEFDMSSLKLINYATEVMPEPLLRRLVSAFPQAEFRQSYGMSELGILRSKSRDKQSCWLKVGGEGFETRIVDGILQIKAESSMLGYINANSPFTADGWFNTQDEVEVDGDWIRVKGRKSDIINVGGEKVYPAEVEAVLLELENVADAVVSRESHPIIGNIVIATLHLVHDEPTAKLVNRVRQHCYNRLPPYKVPVKIKIGTHLALSERFKKDRRND